MFKILGFSLIICASIQVSLSAENPLPGANPGLESPFQITTLLSAIANLSEDAVVQIRSQLSNILNILPDVTPLRKILSGMDLLLENQNALKKVSEALPMLNDLINGMHSIVRMVYGMAPPPGMMPSPGMMQPNSMVPPPFGMPPMSGMIPMAGTFPTPGMYSPFGMMQGPPQIPGSLPMDPEKMREFFLANPVANAAQEVAGVGLKGAGNALGNGAEVGDALYENAKQLNDSIAKSINGVTKGTAKGLETRGKELQERAQQRRRLRSRYNMSELVEA